MYSMPNAYAFIRNILLCCHDSLGRRGLFWSSINRCPEQWLSKADEKLLSYFPMGNPQSKYILFQCQELHIQYIVHTLNNFKFGYIFITIIKYMSCVLSYYIFSLLPVCNNNIQYFSTLLLNFLLDSVYSKKKLFEYIHFKKINCLHLQNTL